MYILGKKKKIIYVFIFIDFNPTINPEESVAYHVSKHLLNYTDAESMYQTLEEVSYILSSCLRRKYFK